MAENSSNVIRRPSENAIKYNGKINGVEGKTPFLIGVAGGTASGKVIHLLHKDFFTFQYTTLQFYILKP